MVHNLIQEKTKLLKSRNQKYIPLSKVEVCKLYLAAFYFFVEMLDDWGRAEVGQDVSWIDRF